jgi:phosphocarrier protein HPr
VQERQVNVANPLGIHARPSASIVQLASRFNCSASLTSNGRRASARNIVAVMLLAATVGSTIVVETDGIDETEAADALASLIGSRFERGRAV